MGPIDGIFGRVVSWGVVTPLPCYKMRQWKLLAYLCVVHVWYTKVFKGKVLQKG